MALSETHCEKNTVVQNTCRVCTVQGKNMMNMFFEKSNDIVDKILFCTGIEFREVPGYPTQICNSCLSNLSIASKFKTTCLLSEENLKALLENCIKEEYVSGDSDNLSDFDLNDNDINLENTENQQINTVEADCLEVKSKKCKLLKNSTSNLVKNSKNIRVSVRKQKQKKSIIIEKDTFPTSYCQPCGISFKMKDEFNKHKREFHSTGSLCEICGKYYSNCTSLYKHLIMHRSQRLLCNFCSYGTPNKQDLDKHMRRHMGLKAYRCDQCPRACHTSSNLLSHIRRNHLKQKRFSCTMCERKFYDRTKLRIHLDGHNSIKRFECDVCHSRFIRRCQWKNHLLKRHSIELPPLKPGPKSADEALQNMFFPDNKE